MPKNEKVAEHYTQGTLLEAIRDGVVRLGKTENTVTLDDLAPVEEFHIGGRLASADFLDQLQLAAADSVLDVGCGLGGTARFAASRSGSRITGVDLTEEFIQTGRVINRWVDLEERITLQQGSATEMTFDDEAFDKAYMIHVGMNISDKTALMKELYRVLKPGGRLGIFDIMRTSDEALTFPVPWATDADGSAVATLAEYCQALESAGFEVTANRNRGPFALSFFEKLQANTAGSDGPPPLGLHIVMGATAAQKIGNMVENVRMSRIAPIEVFATRPG